MLLNNYSDKLKKILEEARPKEGGRHSFTSIAGRVGLPLTDTIIDPDNKSRKLTIAVVDGYVPNPDINSNREDIPDIKRVEFESEDGLSIDIYGDRVEQMDLFDFLYLCRWNKDNQKKPWHIRPAGDQYLFESKNVEVELEKKINQKRKIAQAINKISLMKEKEIRSVAKNIYADYKTASVNTLTDRLILLAESNPEKAVGGAEALNPKEKTMVFVKDLTSAGIIKRLPRKYVYKENEDHKIVTAQPGENLDAAIVRFLNDDKNEQVTKALEGLLAHANGESDSAEEAEQVFDKMFKK